MRGVLTIGHRAQCGGCPSCTAAIVIIVEQGVWPLAECARCDWRGGIDELLGAHLYEVGAYSKALLQQEIDSLAQEADRGQ